LAVGVTVGDQTLSALGVTWLFVVSFGGGIAAGVLVGRVGGIIRGCVPDVLLGTGVSI